MSNDTTHKFKYIDKHYLNLVNHLSRDVLKYNRTLPQSVIDAFPDDVLFPVQPLMVHEHKSGKACEPHMRCMIAVPRLKQGSILEMANSGFDQHIVDVEMGTFDLLPVHEATTSAA